ncbi:hypothetical protein BDY24DRAFT_389389 [Mrakia frigida]|uniref:uncharacterized protein n=1 Tax=Mrakia frigida TaxID=29902 RepID=UPI003FCC1BF9
MNPSPLSRFVATHLHPLLPSTSNFKMLFSATRFFSRAAVAFEEAAAKAPRKSPVYTAATLAKRKLKADATPPVKKPVSGYFAFVAKKGSYPTGSSDFGSTAKANAAAWAELSEAEKKSYSPTKEALEEYHSTLTNWYNSLEPEVQTVAVTMKGFPKSLVKSPRQVAWAENNGASISFTTLLHYMRPHKNCLKRSVRISTNHIVQLISSSRADSSSTSLPSSPFAPSPFAFLLLSRPSSFSTMFLLHSRKDQYVVRIHGQLPAYQRRQGNARF